MTLAISVYFFYLFDEFSYFFLYLLAISRQ